MNTTIRDAARAGYSAGLSILPAKNNGSKMPDLASWKLFQQQRATRDQMRQFRFESREGYGFVAGTVSGVECWDFDSDDVFQAYCQAAQAIGLGDVLDRLLAGYCEATPRGGRHVLVRIPPGVTWKDDTLARRPAPTLDDPHHVETLIERPTWVILAPSHGGTHPSGLPYERLNGDFDRIASYTVDERQALEDLARSFDEMPPRERPVGSAPAEQGGRPGDDFNQRADWMADVLGPVGWTMPYHRHGITYVRRPGKDVGHSGTLNHAGLDLLHVFTDSTQLESGRSYTKFSAYAFLHHAGDFAAAARELGQRGFGTEHTSSEAPHAAASHEPPIVTPLRRDTRPTFPEPDPAMFTGILGKLVDEFEPHTEASRVGMAAHSLVAVGSLIGRQAGAAHVVVDGFAAQFLNEFALIIGDSGDARKQTSWTPIRDVCSRADPHWRHSKGLISGEGLIWDLRDAREIRRGKRLDVDEGVADKRLLIVEEEFSRVLDVGHREGCSLFDTLKEAWDSDVLRTKGKHFPATATQPHASLIGHITPPVLAKRMSAEDATSGWLNRFLHVGVRPSKVLTDPQRIDAARFSHWSDRIAERVAFGQQCGELRRTPEAQKLWNDIYPHRLRRPRRGLMAALCTRAPSHCMRLAGVFTVLALEHQVSVTSLEAALAWWTYCEATLAWVYGVSITGSTTADAILRELRHAGAQGLTKAEMFGLRLARKADELNHDLDTLAELGLAAGRLEHSPKGGRGTERWTAL